MVEFVVGAVYSHSGILAALENAKKALSGSSAQPLVDEFAQWLAKNI
jgi:hypothetical protein